MRASAPVGVGEGETVLGVDEGVGVGEALGVGDVLDAVRLADVGDALGEVVHAARAAAHTRTEMTRRTRPGYVPGSRAPMSVRLG